MSVFESTLKENPKFVPGLTNLGYANLLSGEASKAETLYNRAAALDPDYDPLLMNMAGLYIYQKRLDKAKEMLEKVLKKNPKNEQAKKVLNQSCRLLTSQWRNRNHPY
jgi:tetratricopeptide (TPR) repeat protein